MHQNNSNSYSNGGLDTKPTIAIAIVPPKEQDRLVAWAHDLIVPEYRLWFIKRLQAVGKQRFVEAANNARRYDGDSRKRVFTYLLKEAS